MGSVIDSTQTEKKHRGVVALSTLGYRTLGALYLYRLSSTIFPGLLASFPFVSFLENSLSLGYNARRWFVRMAEEKINLYNVVVNNLSIQKRNYGRKWLRTKCVRVLFPRETSQGAPPSLFPTISIRLLQLCPCDLCV